MRKLVLTFFVSLFGGFLALSVHNLYYDHSNNNISDEKDNMVNISFNPSSSKNCLSFSNGNSEQLFNIGLCLPSGSNITENELHRIVGVLNYF